MFTMCANPFNPPGTTGLFPCRDCLPCRLARRRLWQTRIYLESCCHRDNTFLTLTYDDDHLPHHGTLVPADYQKFLKRVRKSISPSTLRYYFVGEYGDISQRPHYHAAIFGLPPSFPYSDFWDKGFVYPGILTPESAQYVAGYVMKKLTKPDHPDLNGRFPEFARMSLKPGIGALAVDSLNSSTAPHMPFDVPTSFRVNGKNTPIGPYLIRKLREARFTPDEIENIKTVNRRDRHEEMLILHPDALYHPQGIRAYARQQTQGQRDSLIARHQIFGVKNEKI